MLKSLALLRLDTIGLKSAIVIRNVRHTRLAYDIALSYVNEYVKKSTNQRDLRL